MQGAAGAGALLLVSASSWCPAYAATLAVTQLGITSLHYDIVNMAM